MSRATDKAALRAELVAQLEAQLATARAAHASAIEGATHGEARAENDKDTRGLEQSYVARGQAARVAELDAAVAIAQRLPVAPWRAGAPIAAGSLVTVDDGGARRRYLVAGAGGGLALAGGVVVVTPTSPLGRALCGRGVGDDLEARGPGGVRTLEVLTVE